MVQVLGRNACRHERRGDRLAVFDVNGERHGAATRCPLLPRLDDVGVEFFGVRRLGQRLHRVVAGQHADAAEVRRQRRPDAR
jgi:hypothetical protein